MNKAQLAEIRADLGDLGAEPLKPMPICMGPRGGVPCDCPTACLTRILAALPALLQALEASERAVGVLREAVDNPAFWGAVFAAQIAAEGKALNAQGQAKALADLDALRDLNARMANALSAAAGEG